MAVALEGFSIRQYAAKMRTIDVVKCWPFGKDSEAEMKEEDIKALLPPITVAKFRWWSHELQSFKSNQIHEENENIQQEPVEFSRNESGFSSEKPRLEKSQMLEEKLEMLCPVCRVFTAATVNAVNAHVDSCLAESSQKELRRQMKKLAMKAKMSKPTKKRSIAEIFAVAPQIEAVDVDDENLDEDSSGGEDRFGSSKVSSEDNVVSTVKGKTNIKKKMKNEKKKKMKKKKKMVLEENGMAIVSKLKMNKKFKKKAVRDGSIAKKESLHKLKPHLPVGFTGKLNGSSDNERFPEDILDTASMQGEKPSLNCLSMEKKLKAVQTSELIAKHQNAVLPIRSILKNHKKLVPTLNSAICILQCGSQANHYGSQRPDRHVRFSDKDDILGPRKKNSSDVFDHSSGDQFSDDSASSSEKDQSTEHGKEVSPMEVEGNYNDAFIRTDSRTEVQPKAGKEQSLNIHKHVEKPCLLRPRVACQENMHHFPDKSHSLRQFASHDDGMHMSNQGYTSMSCKPAYAGIPTLISALEERHNPCVNAQVGDNVRRAFSDNGKLINHLVDSVHSISVISSMADTAASSQPSSSCFVLDENANRRLPFLSQSATKSINGSTSHYQPFCHLSPIGLMNSTCLSPEQKQKSVPFRENCIDDRFFGLPLNSQGELIQFSSSGRGGFDQRWLPSTITGSLSSLPAHNLVLPQSTADGLNLNKPHFIEREYPKDPLDLFPLQNYVTDNPKVHLPARLGVTELEGTGRSDVRWLNSQGGNYHSVRLLDSELSLSDTFSPRYRRYNQMQNQNPNGIIHPKENSDKISPNSTQTTMRLMGKDVAVGRSSQESQEFEDGKIWTEREIIVNDCPASRATDGSALERNFLQDWMVQPASGRLEDPVAQSLGVQCNHMSQSNLVLKASDSRFSDPYSNWEADAVHRNGSITINKNPSGNVHSFVQSSASPVMFSGASSPQEPFVSRAETLSVVSELPLLPGPHSASNHLPWSSFGLKDRQNLPHATKSAFNFPFMHPDCRDNVQPSWFQRSSECVSPWLSHAQQDKPLIAFSQPFSDVGGRYPPQLISEKNCFSSPPVNHLPVSYCYSPVNSHPRIKTSLSPASVLHSCVSAIPAVELTSSSNKDCRNGIKLKDTVKSKAFGIKMPHSCKKVKRPTAKADRLTKPGRIPNLEMQKDLSSVMGLTREKCDIQCNAGVAEFYPSRDKAIMLEHCPSENQKYVLHSSSGIDPSQVDNLARSGPIKLSAGAKHILKPSQAADQDSSRLIHSTLPFAMATNCGGVPNSQKKLTKIYRF